MSNNLNNKSNQKNDGMLKEKTNEDYNNQIPNSKDPNQSKNQQIGKIYDDENQASKINAKVGASTRDSGTDKETSKDSQTKNK